jgi:DNA-binding LacI/PurR family transcriptional regulator
VDQIEAGAGKRPTLEDVAARAGMSRSLVSLVMRGARTGATTQTRERVLQAAAEIGYRPDARARLLASGESRLIGVVFGMAGRFHLEFLDGLYVAAKKADYQLILSALTPRRDEGEAVETLLDFRCEAAIILAPDRAIPVLAGRLPVVTVGWHVKNPAVDVVRTSDEEGMRQAVDHLVGLGHRDIAYIDGGHNPGADLRRDGYLAAMDDHGLTGAARVVSGGYTEDEGTEAGLRLLTDGLPTAVVAANDPCAIGLLDVVIRAGVRVPQDLSVIGYDDSRFGVIPGIDLTSVRQNIPRTARLAVKTVVARLDNPDSRRRHLVTRPALTVRGSTAPPPPID